MDPRMKPADAFRTRFFHVVLGFTGPGCLLCGSGRYAICIMAIVASFHLPSRDPRVGRSLGLRRS